MSVRSTAAQVDRGANHSSPLAWATRFGLVGYGFVHLLVAWVAIRIATVGGGGRATGAGALAQLTEDPVGRLTLGALAAGFAGLALWQVLAAAVGYRDLDGWRRHLMRAGAAARVVIYAYFGVASARLLLHQGSGRAPRSAAAGLLAQPAGELLLGAAGVTAAAVGVGLVVFGIRRQFVDQIDHTVLSTHGRRIVVLVGQVGYVTKGAAFVLIGVLVCWAAVTQSPRATGGLDRSFDSLLGTAAGGPAVVVAGLGIGCFGLYLLARACFLDTHSLTS